ncbi:MAG: hypothetical protein ACE361_20555 [Aureliella sp.]
MKATCRLTLRFAPIVLFLSTFLVTPLLAQHSGRLSKPRESEAATVSIARIEDVSGMKSEIRSDLSRLMNQVQPSFEFKTSRNGFDAKDGNAGVNGRVMSGAGGGSGSVKERTTFTGPPKIAIAVRVDPSEDSELSFVDPLKLVDHDGQTYEPLPTSRTHFMVCPKFENQNPGTAIAYFAEPAPNPENLKSLSGKIKIRKVKFDEVVFDADKPSSIKKTQLGTYKLTRVSDNQFKVLHPVPSSLSMALAPPQFGQTSSVLQRMHAMQHSLHSLKVKFIGSDGVEYRPQSSTQSGGSAFGGARSGSSARAASNNGGNGQTHRAAGARGVQSRRGAAPQERDFTLPSLPYGVKIERVEVRVHEPTTEEKIIDFELSNLTPTS